MGAPPCAISAGRRRLGAVQQAEHREGPEQPHRVGACGEVADQGGWGDGDLERGGQGHGGDQQQHGPMPEPLGLLHRDLHGQGQGLGAQRPQLGNGAGGVDHGPAGLHRQDAGDEPDDHGQDVLGPAHDIASVEGAWPVARPGRCQRTWSARPRRAGRPAGGDAGCRPSAGPGRVGPGLAGGRRAAGRHWPGRRGGRPGRGAGRPGWGRSSGRRSRPSRGLRWVVLVGGAAGEAGLCPRPTAVAACGAAGGWWWPDRCSSWDGDCP
jgi:translation initiation factor IF-2